MAAEPPEVIQGKLGWESGDISEAKPEELEPHPKNKEIYGDTESVDDLDETFKESVAEKGVLEPLVITEGKQIVSGHRRWLAANAAELKKIPVRYAEFDSELAEREALIEFNRQREKNQWQITNEFDEMLKIEQERAKKRLREAGSVGGKGKEIFPDPSKGQSRDNAAKRVNADVTGRTLEKWSETKEEIEKKAESKDTPDPVREVAKEQRDRLKRGETSFSKASKEIEIAEAEQAVAEQEQPDTDFPPIVREQDAIDFLESVGSADLVIADPPYSTDVDDIKAFASRWVPPMLDTIGDGGRAFVFIGAYPDELNAYLKVLDVYSVLDRTQVLVWTYRNTLGQTPKDRYKLNWQAILFIQSDPAREIDSPKTSEQWAVQDVNAPDARIGERHHEWEKPSDLIRRFIRHTTDEGDLVVDPFVGTGTTVLEAADLGRETKGCDVDPEMLEIAEERGCILR